MKTKKKILYLIQLIILLFFYCGSLFANPIHIEINPKDGEKFLKAKFDLWLPSDIKTIRGIIVHQHGCSRPAEESALTGAYDLQWQELARKHQFALLVPSLNMNNECSEWSRPANGTERAFLDALDIFSDTTGHPELKTVPWALWGHSGGSSWVYHIFLNHGEKVIALFLRSGPPRLDTVSDKFIDVPIIFNMGLKEKTSERYSSLFESGWKLYNYRRQKGAPVCWVTDPTAEHGCKKSRLLAIPFFDECIRQRLSEDGTLKKLNISDSWSGNLDDYTILAGNNLTSTFLINKKFAESWKEFINTGNVTDITAPTAPFNLKLSRQADSVLITWDALTDFESGIRTFKIVKNGNIMNEIIWDTKEWGAIKDFRQLSFFDTPLIPLHQMKFIDKDVKKGEKYEYAIITINGSELESENSKSSSILIK